MTRPPTDEECVVALRDMAVGKAVGPSGQPVEYCKHAPPCIQQIIWSNIRVMFAEGDVPKSFKEGQIYCPPKTDSPIASYANVRPTTLLEQIKLKLMTRVLIKRVDVVMALT